jgi:hypothetical protein
MVTTSSTIGTKGAKSAQQYRLPGIEREGIAQLSLLETALWPLQGGRLPTQEFQTTYAFKTAHGQKSATVTVRSPLGLQSIDEYVLWGLLGATLSRPEAGPILLATPFWMLKHLGLATGGSQYAELRDALFRLGTTSYQNTAFYNPESQERESVMFQFLSLLLPTVDGVGETVDNDRSWRIEWNPAFYRFCKATGGTLLFDLDLYRRLSPASRRLFLKLKDRFWRGKRVFLNVEDLTVNGLGFAADRPQRKRKFDLLACLRELLDHDVIELGHGQTDAKELFLKRGKGSYVVLLHEGEYFRRRESGRVSGPKNAILENPLYEPLRKIGVDGAGIERLLKHHSHSLVQRWVRITDAAMHEKPRGFPGFRASPAAFLIDGVQQKRMPPDWLYAHEKRREREQWRMERAVTGDDGNARQRYEQERNAALNIYLASAEGKAKYEEAFGPLLAFYKVTEPNRFREAAHEAACARVERLNFPFPEFAVWQSQRPKKTTKVAA